MKPRAMVVFYFTSIILLVVLCVISALIAVIRHSFLSVSAAIAITGVMTFFASSSKFAKEVKWIRRWRRVTRRPIETYPQTVEQRIHIRRQLYPELEKRGMMFNTNKDRLESALMSRAPDEEVADLRVRKYRHWSDFFVFWSVLRHVKSLPLNLATGQPWKGKEHEEFLKSIKPGVYA